MPAVAVEGVRRRDNQAQPQSEGHEQENRRGQKNHRQRGPRTQRPEKQEQRAHRQEQRHQVDQDSSQREDQLGNEYLPDQRLVRDDAQGTLIHATTQKTPGDDPRKQVHRIVLDTAKKKRENPRQDRHHQQRIEQRPEEAKDRSLIADPKILAHQVLDDWPEPRQLHAILEQPLP